jgi:hypothetical protein
MLQLFVFQFESIPGDFDIPIEFMKAISFWVAELFLKQFDYILKFIRSNKHVKNQKYIVVGAKSTNESNHLNYSIGCHCHLLCLQFNSV